MFLECLIRFCLLLLCKLYHILILNKFYCNRGSPLGRRLKEREKEKEADMRDRQREKEELEELKRKLLDQGHPDPEAELARVSIHKSRKEEMHQKYI